VDIHASDSEEIAASRISAERFAVIFDRHFVAIRDYLRRRINHSLADELAAESFVVAFRSRATYDLAYSSARPWLFGIAANLLKRHRRQEKRELRAYARSAVDPVQAQASSDAAQYSHDLAIGPALGEALATLSPMDREVLFLFAVADLSYEEISRALDIRIGTVRSRLFRARTQIRELLDTQRAIPGESIFHGGSSQ
jgi:RNA polymerase sigma factor (sigma-70 family)